MSIRKRFASSKVANQFGSALIYYYVKFCYASTHWTREGFEEMEALLRSGKPVMIVLWHERLWMSPYMFNTALGKICSIMTSSRIARLGHCILRRFEFEAVAVDPKQDAARANRQVLALVNNGYSLAISPDGTRGPPRVCKSFPIKWARKKGLPIFCVTFSMRKTLRTTTWDRSLIPLPFNRGALLARRWDHLPLRTISKDQLEKLSTDLGDQLNMLTEEADQKTGRRK